MTIQKQAGDNDVPKIRRIAINHFVSNNLS